MGGRHWIGKKGLLALQLIGLDRAVSAYSLLPILSLHPQRTVLPLTENNRLWVTSITRNANGQPTRMPLRLYVKQSTKSCLQ